VTNEEAQPDENPSTSDETHEKTPDPAPSVITSASDKGDVAQIIYGLSIRGVRSCVVENTTKLPPDPAHSCSGAPERFLIVHDTPTAIQIQIAQEAIGAIWDAILEEHPRAVTLSGLCVFCDYDVSTLPKPTICPECGTNLDSIGARRAIRDRRKI
jgi:hypothetical protein